MNLTYRINPKVDVPLYTQLTDMLRADITGGKLPHGTKLPTVRELSDSCGIARGTVIRAYDTLEQQGLLEKVQGRGTFVCYRELTGQSRKDLAMEAIDTMLNTMEQLRFSKSEIDIYLNLKLRERDAQRNTVRLAVVECNYEILSTVSRQLRELGGTDVYSYHLDDIRLYPYQIPEDTDLVVVSATHAEELKALLPEKLPQAKAALRILPRTIAQIVRIPAGSGVGILCRSRRFGNLLYALCNDCTEGMSIGEPELFEGDVAAYLKGKSAVLVPTEYENFCSTKVSCLLDSFRKKGGLLIPCEYRIDEGSMMYIAEKIKRIMEKKA